VDPGLAALTGALPTPAPRNASSSATVDLGQQAQHQDVGRRRTASKFFEILLDRDRLRLPGGIRVRARVPLDSGRHGKIELCQLLDSEDGVVAWAAGLTSFLTDPIWCPF